MKKAKNVPFGQKRGNLSPHRETTLNQVVTIGLGKSSPLLRDSDNNIIGNYAVSGAIDASHPAEFTAKIGTLNMRQMFVDLFPHIVFTVTKVAPSGQSKKDYRLTPHVLKDATDPRLDDSICALSLVEFGILLYNFTFEVDDVASGTSAYYQVSAQPECGATPACNPELHQRNHGDLSLDVIGDMLEYMEFSIAPAQKPTAQTKTPYCTQAADRLVIVICNKYRRE